MKTMLALIKKPNEPAIRVALPEEDRAQLAAMQAAVGGYVETALRGPDFVVWCNEEGRLLHLPLNFMRPTDGELIVGAVIVTGPLVGSRDGFIPSPLDEATLPRIGALLAAWSAALPLCDLEVDERLTHRNVEGEITIDGVGVVISKGWV